jgi:hypothetical protein
VAIANLKLSKAQGLTEACFVVGKDQDRVSGALVPKLIRLVSLEDACIDSTTHATLVILKVERPIKGTFPKATNNIQLP